LLFWEDECWFSRFAQPRLKAWGELQLSQRMMLPRAPDKALSYYGVKRQDTGEIYLYPAWQRPNSDETIQFLFWLVAGAAVLRRKVVLVIWDNASWHVARKVKRWIRGYNLAAKFSGQPRLLVCGLPKRSPWLNPIEAHWMHAKKRVCEPSNDELSPYQLRQRVFQALDARFVAALSQPVS
jgi:transposase